MDTVLELENVSVHFDTPDGTVQAVRDVSLSLKSGETLAIVGESGCGKSVLCKSVMKLLPGNARISGKMLIDGKDIAPYTEKQMRKLRGSLFSMLFQDPITTLNSVMIEYISGMKLIKAYNMGSKSFQKFSDAIQEENAMWNETSRRMGPPYAAFVVIIECGMLLMVPIGGMFFLKGSLAASAFLLFVYVGSMYLTEIRPLQELGTNFANVLNAVTKTKEILDIPIYEGGTDFPQNHDIELRNVRFSYDGKTDVLQGVNLKINDGERVALVGQSGAGKSTVIELISRFYDVQEGEVLIGGKNVKELDYDTILKNVAIVFQKTFLTRDSVLENIRMGSNATLEEVRAAAKEAQIDDFIMSLPDGYDTKVGSFGSRFSGGEKQRIAIARAILKNAPILILDEATSASDPENQMEIDKAIQNLCKGKTVIVVAHRLSALKMCNRVAVVENHTITNVGTHEEVRKNNAYYRKAWDDYETARNITYQLEGGEQYE